MDAIYKTLNTPHRSAFSDAQEWRKLVAWRDGISADMIRAALEKEPQSTTWEVACECETEEFIGGSWEYECQEGKFKFGLVINRYALGCALAYRIERV